MVTGRKPAANELDLIYQFYQKEKKWYQENEKEALAYLGVGEYQTK